MLTYAAVGTPAEVGDYLDGFAKTADADELIVAHQAPTTEGRLRSVDPARRGDGVRPRLTDSQTCSQQEAQVTRMPPVQLRSRWVSR